MTEDEVRERLAYLSAAQHEANTPLAVIRGWADTFATMWEDLATADRERGVGSIQRFTGEVIELLDALFVELRADAHTRAPAGASAQVAQVVPGAVDQTRDVELEGDAPAVTVAIGPDGLEVLVGAIAVGLRIRTAAPVSVSVQQREDAAVVSFASEAPAPEGTSDDPFDPFPGGDASPSGIRLYAARRLAESVGGELSSANRDGLRLILPLG